MEVIRSPELGAEVKAAREAAGLSHRDLSARLGRGYSQTKLSLIETGRRLPSVSDLTTILAELSVSDEDRERILGMRRAADDAPGQISVGSPQIGESLAQLIAYERAAVRIVDVAPLLIPGLLQIREYSEAVLRDVSHAETRVALRAGRRDILTGRSPVELLALIDSEVLVRPVAPREVMVDQLRHLLEMAARPNITLQIVSSTAPGYNPMLSGPFKILEFAESPSIVHNEQFTSSTFLWAPREVARYLSASEQISEAAMTPAESAGVIEDIVHGMETT